MTALAVATESDVWEIVEADCLELLRQFPDNSIDAIVTDPPYGMSSQPDIVEVLTHWLAGDRYEHGGGGFMGKTWDSFVPGPEYWRECFRVLKPGGHLLAFAAPRTYDLMGVAVRLGGFEVRDMLSWLFGTGFPKSLDVSKAIRSTIDDAESIVDIASRAIALQQWEGWGTALKPACARRGERADVGHGGVEY